MGMGMGMGMDDQPQEPDDAVQLHIEDLRGVAGAELLDDRAVTPSTVFSRPRRPPSHRAGRVLVVLGLVVIAVAVVLAGDPALREGATGLVRWFVPTPSPTLGPGVDRFAFLPVPPGVDVRLDGRVLTRLPLLGDPHPLVLSRGRHTLRWDSTWLPFQGLECVVSVPPMLGVDTCPLQGTHPRGWVIALHPSLTTLAREQAQGLSAAIREALAAADFTAPVRVGDHYAVGTEHPPSLRVATATAPLRATLRFFVPTASDDGEGGQDAFLPEPCRVDLPLSCRFPSQDCGQICTLPTAPTSGGSGDGSTREWIAAIGVTTGWTYATPGGRIVGAGGPDPFGSHLVVLRITWDSAGTRTGTGPQWHVVPLVGHTAGLPATDAADCDTPLAQLNSTTWSFMVTDPPPGAQVIMASGAAPGEAAEGCVLVVVGHGTPPPVFLGRFGVLMTVNETARNPVDSLPAANGAEQQLAQDLMAQLPL